MAETKQGGSGEQPGGAPSKSTASPSDGKLRFFAKADLLVTVPGTPTLKYVNRASDGKNAWPAVEQPFAVDPNTDAGRRLVKLTRRDQSLFPADQFTANACGVPYVRTRFVDGEHVSEVK